MMKWAHRLLGLLLGILLVTVCLRILLPAFQGNQGWSEFLAEVQGQRIGVIGAVLLVLLGIIGYILTALTLTPRPKYLAYETQFGNISISLKALQEFLGHLKTEFPTIVELSPRVVALDESLDIILVVRVRSGAPIPEISRLLQERTRTLIHEKIGIADIRNIEVKIEEIVREKEPQAQLITPQPPPAGEVP